MGSEIKLVGGHLDDPPAYALPLITAIGLALLHWGRLEQQIDVLLISVNKDDHSAEKYRPTPNSSFRIKCDLFERWFAKDSRFIEHHDKAKRLLKAFRLANDDRTLLVHSNVQEFREGPPHVMVVRNLKIEGPDQDLRISRAEWTEEHVLGFAKSVSGLNHGLYTISEKVLTREFLESLRSDIPLAH